MAVSVQPDLALLDPRRLAEAMTPWPAIATYAILGGMLAGIAGLRAFDWWVRRGL